MATDSAGKTAADSTEDAALAVRAVGLVSLLILLRRILLAISGIFLLLILRRGVLLLLLAVVRSGFALVGLRIGVVAAVVTHDKFDEVDDEVPMPDGPDSPLFIYFDLQGGV
jgi:hypothetical protein